jgi:hypothetical protein
MEFGEGNQETGYGDLQNVSGRLGVNFKYGPDDLKSLFYALNSLEEKAK